MRRAVYIIVACVVVVLMTRVLIVGSRKDKLGNNARNGFKDNFRIQPVPVRVRQAFIGDLTKEVMVSGITEALLEVDLKARVSSQVSEVFVVEGQEVSKGTTLVSLDDREYLAELQEAKASLLSARLEYILMKTEQPKQIAGSRYSTSDSLRKWYEQAKADYDSGSIDMEELLRIECEYQTNMILGGYAREELMAHKSGLSIAEASFVRAEILLSNCTIKAPWTGIVGNIDIHPGDIVSSGQIVMKILDDSSMRLRLQVMEEDIGKIQEGDAIHVKTVAFPDTVFVGSIIAINPIVREDLRSGLVFGSVQNQRRLLMSGMYVTAKISVSHSKERLLVPREAVVERDQRKLVFIVRNKNAFWCYVETGAENSSYIEIKSSEYNLLSGEPVIVDGHFALAHDSPVTVVGEDK